MRAQPSRLSAARRLATLLACLLLPACAAPARHPGEGLFEFVLLDADRSVSSDGYGAYTDVAYTTFFRPGNTVSGSIGLTRNSRQGLPPGDYWVRVTLNYTLADDPTLPLWQQPRYALSLDVPFTVVKE